MFEQLAQGIEALGRVDAEALSDDELGDALIECMSSGRPWKRPRRA